MEYHIDYLENIMIRKGEKQWFRRTGDKYSLFDVHGIGYYEQMTAGMVNRPDGTGDILLMLFYNPVELGYRGEVIPLQAGSFVLWPAGAAHYYGNPHKPFAHSWLHCTGTHANRLVTPAKGLRILPPSKEGNSQFARLVQDLYIERNRAEYDPLIMRNLFHNFLLQRNRAESPEDAHPIPENFLALQGMLARNFSQTFRLPQLAATVNYSVPQFCVKYREYFGTTVFAYIMELRMTEATYLLRDLNLSISEIAERTGFPDVYHFSKQFKKYHGVSPTQHRSDMSHSQP